MRDEFAPEEFMLGEEGPVFPLNLDDEEEGDEQEPTDEELEDEESDDDSDDLEDEEE